MPSGVALGNSLPLFGVLMPKGERFRPGLVFLHGVVESQAWSLVASVFLLVNSFPSFALVWCETLSYGVRHMLPWLSLLCPYVCDCILICLIRFLA